MKTDFSLGLAISFFLAVSHNIEVIISKALCHYSLGKILYDHKMLYIFKIYLP